MTRTGKEPDTLVLHVDGDQAGALGRVHQERNARFLCKQTNLSDGLDGAGDVRAMGDDDEAGIATQGCGHVAGVQEAAAVAGNPGYLRAPHPGQVERSDHRIMFHGGGNHVSAGPHQPQDRYIESFRCIAGERDAG